MVKNEDFIDPTSFHHAMHNAFRECGLDISPKDSAQVQRVFLRRYGVNLDGVKAKKRIGKIIYNLPVTAMIYRVAEENEVDVEGMLGHRRFHQLSHARMEAMARMHLEHGVSTNRIGLIFDNRDHTTVLSAVTGFRNGELDTAFFRSKKEELA